MMSPKFQYYFCLFFFFFNGTLAITDLHKNGVTTFMWVMTAFALFHLLAMFIWKREMNKEQAESKQEPTE